MARSRSRSCSEYRRVPPGVRGDALQRRRSSAAAARQHAGVEAVADQLSRELVPFSRVLGDFDETAAILIELADADPAIELGFLPPLDTVRLY